MLQRARLQAIACMGLFVLLTLTISPKNGSDPSDWVSRDAATYREHLKHAAPGSAEAFKLERKIERLHAFEEGRPQPGFPDEYARILHEMRIPSDRTAPEYEPGYQVRELATARSLSKASAIALPWVSRGPGNVAGRARGLLVDPDDVTSSTWYIGAVGGGVWKTDDAGASWTDLTTGMPNINIGCIAQSQSDPDVIYAGTGESFFNIDTLNGNGVIKTTDRGQTWVQLPSTVGDLRFNNISRIIIHPASPDTLVLSATVGRYTDAVQPSSSIFRSTDGGASWTEVYTETDVSTFGTTKRILQVIADPNDFDRQYATIDEKGILRSTDGGVTWAEINTGITDFEGRFELAISPINGDYVFASAEGADHSELWVSIDGGDNWYETTELGGTSNEPNWLGAQGWYDNTIVCDPLDANVVYVGGIRLWKIEVLSLGAASRVTTPLSTGSVHVDNHGLLAFNIGASSFQLLNTNDGGVGVSSTNSSNWTAPIDGMVTTQFYGVEKRPGASAYAGGMQDNGTWVSPVDSDALSPWSFGIGGDGYEVAWHFNDPERLIGGYQFNGFSRSLDGGQSWSDATSGLADTGGGNAPFITKIGQSNADPDRIYAVGVQGVWYSSDFGGSWDLASMPGTGWGPLNSFHDVRVCEADPTHVWAGAYMDTTGSLLVSTDSGLSFTATTNYTDVTMGRVSGIATDPVDNQTAYAMFSFAQRPKVLKTTDLGATWTDISGFGSGATSTTGFPDVAVYDLLVFPNDTNRIWVGTEIGLVETLDGGASWALADNGLPTVGIWYLTAVEDEVIVATHGRGVWSVQIPELEAGLTFNPLLEKASQGPDGFLRVVANLRSVYDSTVVRVDGVAAATFGPNVVRQIEVVALPVAADGTRTVDVESYLDGTLYPSLTKVVQVYALAPESVDYATDFSAGADFTYDGFTVTQPAGFSDEALHTSHPYLDSSSPIALLKQPIYVAGNSTLSFDEIAIIEPGDPGTVFGDFAFWDYVIVEGTTDGVNWVPLEDGYDATYDSDWEDAYRSSNIGDETLYKPRVMDLTAAFGKGSTILLRFRLYADGFVHGWGWAIDNILIDSTGGAVDAPAPRRFALEQNIPNPFNPTTRIDFSLERSGPVSLRIYDSRGRLVRTLVDEVRAQGPQSVVWEGRDDRGARAASGVYHYRLVAGNQIQHRKMTLVK